MPRSSNMTGGSEAAKNTKLTKAATSSKGKGKQPKGSSKHNTKPRYAKMEKNPSKDIEF